MVDFDPVPDRNIFIMCVAFSLNCYDNFGVSQSTTFNFHTILSQGRDCKCPAIFLATTSKIYFRDTEIDALRSVSELKDEP